MAGRPAKPIALHIQNGNKRHLTKAEIEQRQKSEVRLGDKKLKCPDFVKNDIEAYKKWKELTHLYKDVEFVSSGDSGTLARYCKIYSEYIRLINERDKLASFEINWDERGMTVDEALEDGINKLLRLDPLMRLESAINKKHELLIKLDDRLFLNPVSKIKNIPKKEAPKQVDPFEAKFGDI